MSIGDVGDALLDHLAEEFTERLRRGERPSVAEYTQKHPELAERISELFRTIVTLEQLGQSAGEPRGEVNGGGELEGTLPKELGDYRIVGEMGRGGMGIVLEAEQISLGRHVALKIMLGPVLHDEALSERFYREAKAAAQLHHTNIVPVFGYGKDKGLCYYAMQLIRGQSLDKVLNHVRLLRAGRMPNAEHVPAAATDPANARAEALSHTLAQSLMDGAPSSECRLPAEYSTHATVATTLPALSNSASAASSKIRKASTVGESAAVTAESGAAYFRRIAKLGVEVADALHYAHREGVLHRDIKPANLLLDERGVAWLTDFGLAKLEGSVDVTGQSIPCTLRYMAPERLSREADARSDVYSLGLTLYELLTLRPAFEEQDYGRLVSLIKDTEPAEPRTLEPRIPRNLDTIVLRAIAKEPDRRYPTAKALADDLRLFLDNRPITARRAGPLERLRLWFRRSPVVAVLAGAVVALCIVSMVILLRAYFRQRDLREAETLARTDEAAARRVAETTVIDMNTALGLVAAERDRPYEAVAWYANAAALSGNDIEREIANCARYLAWSREIALPRRAFMLEHSITALSFDHRGRYLLVRDGLPRWSLFDVEREQTLPLPFGAINAAAWMPNADALALAWAEGGVDIVSVPELRQLRRLSIRGPITAIGFSPDGRHLAIGGTEIQVWDCEPGGFASPAIPLANQVREIRFSCDGQKIATTSDDRRVRVFVLGSATEPSRLVFATPTNQVNVAPVFLDHGRIVVTKAVEDELVYWDADTGARKHALRLDSTLKALAPSSDGQYLVWTGFPYVEVRNAGGARVNAQPMRHGNWVEDAVFSPRGDLVLSVSGDRMACVWTTRTGTPVVQVPHLNGVTRGAFAPDGRQFATGQADGLVRIWSLPSPGEDYRLPVPFLDHKLVLRRDGRYAMSAGWWSDRQALATRVYDLATGKPDGPQLHVDAYINGGAICPTSRTVVLLSALPEDRGRIRGSSVGWDRHPGIITFWDWQTGRRLLEPEATPSEPIDAEFSPDGQLVVVVCAAGQVLLLDPLTGRTQTALRHPDTANGNYGWKPIRWVGFSAQGDKFFTTGIGHTVQVWDTAKRSLIRPISHGDTLRDVRFSPSGRWLAAAIENQVKVWDMTSGKLAAAPLDHPDWVFSVVFSPDDRRILTACRDHMARLWNWRTGAKIGPALEHADELFCADFSADGRWVATASRDGTARVWDCATGRPVVPPLRLTTGGSPGFGQQIAFTAVGKLAVAGRTSALDIFDLSLLSQAEGRELDLPSLRAAGELTGGREVIGGGTVNLNTAEWFKRWQAIRTTRPDALAAWKSPSRRAGMADDAMGRRGPAGSDAVWTDLLGLVDPSRHSVHGHWMRQGSHLAVAAGDFSRMAIPLRPTGSYELRVDFECLVGRPEVNLMCPMGNHTCTVYLGGGSGFFSGVHEFRTPLDEFDTGRFLQTGLKYTACVRVTWNDPRIRIELELNGCHEIDWSGTSDDLENRIDWLLPTQSLGLGTHNGSVVFRAAELHLLSGEARRRIEFDRSSPVPLQQWLNALSEVDVSVHSVIGAWDQRDGHLSVRSAGFSRVMLPLEAIGSYELTASFTWQVGDAEVSFLLPIGSADCMFFMNKDRVGLDTVKEAGNSETKRYVKVPLRTRGGPGEYEVRIAVTVRGSDAEVQAKVIGPAVKTDFSWHGRVQDLDLRHEWCLPTHAFGLGVHQDSVTFRSIQVRCLDGEAWRLKTIKDAGTQPTN